MAQALPDDLGAGTVTSGISAMSYCPAGAIRWQVDQLFRTALTSANGSESHA